MYYVKKDIEISSCHHLNLSYESKCQEPHGHDWQITVYCKAKTLNVDGMVCDFTQIKELVQDKLDHKNLNDVFDFNPTAENIAKWIVDQIDTCYRADVQESKDNLATYEED